MRFTANEADLTAAALLILSPGNSLLLPLVPIWPSAKPFQHTKWQKLFFSPQKCLGVYTRAELHVNVHIERFLHSIVTEAAEFGVRRALELAQRRIWQQEPEVRSSYAASDKLLALG